MNHDLKELLLLIRQHEAFHDLLNAMPSPQPKHFKTTIDAHQQHTDWIFNSGRARENDRWRRFLIEGNPSDKE